MIDLPMKPFHQRLIAKGDKTTTLRGKVWRPDTYRMYGYGESVGNAYMELLCEYTAPVFIVFEADGMLDWTRQTISGKYWLAKSEGYESVAEFESFMRCWKIWGKPFGERFITGERNLWLHSVVYVEANDE